MTCDTCKARGHKNFTLQDRCLPCFKKNAVLVHNEEKMTFDSRKDAALRDSIEQHASEYPSQREAFQRAVDELERGLPGAALTTLREARAAAKKEAVK